jgi:hypothetical protein
VKQGYDYDPLAEYVRAWVSELSSVLEPREVFQGWEIRQSTREELGLVGNVGIERPLLKIDFTVGKRGRHLGRGMVARIKVLAGVGEELVVRMVIREVEVEVVDRIVVAVMVEEDMVALEAIWTEATVGVIERTGAIPAMVGDDKLARE